MTSLGAFLVSIKCPGYKPNATENEQVYWGAGLTGLMKSSGFTARNKVVVCVPRRPGFSKFLSFGGFPLFAVGGSGAEDILITEEYHLKTIYCFKYQKVTMNGIYIYTSLFETKPCFAALAGLELPL